MNRIYVFARLLGLSLVLLACAAFLAAPAHADESDADTGAPEAGEDVDWKKVKSPIKYTEKSIKRGRMLYQRRCTECHGADGKGQMDVIADASDLTRPKYYYSGSTEGEVFRSIRDGSGVSMPPFKEQIRKEADMWHLVNYIRSLWPPEQRPELQNADEEAEAETEDDADASDE